MPEKLKNLGRDVNALLEGNRRNASRLGQAQARSAIPVSTGIGTVEEAQSESAGISSPLTEADISKRTYHPAHTLTSSDGLFTLEYESVAYVEMTDAENRLVGFNYADPDATP